MTATPRHSCQCGATWPGLSPCHCSACHRTFSGVVLFDKHRHAQGEHGGCHDPETIRNRRTGEKLMFLRDDGIWHGPEMDKAALNRRTKPRKNAP